VTNFLNSLDPIANRTRSGQSKSDRSRGCGNSGQAFPANDARTSSERALVNHEKEPMKAANILSTAVLVGISIASAVSGADAQSSGATGDAGSLASCDPKASKPKLRSARFRTGKNYGRPF